jgi:hypothetical protein
MSLIEKEYFTLPEVMERWGLPLRDIVYSAENGQLRVSVRVFGLAIERGYFEEDPDGTWFRVPCEQTRFDGILDLLARDAFVLFRDGEVGVGSFQAESGQYIDTMDLEPFLVREADLVISRAERDRFEQSLRLSSPSSTTAGLLRHTDDYREVRLGEQVFHLGPIQAGVVKHLHAAAIDGRPWCAGKAVLAAAGSQSMRLADVFKSQSRWRRLIQSNGRGQYRLMTAAQEAPAHPPPKS